jgi:glycyl-tRNA synthetase beta chain
MGGYYAEKEGLDPAVANAIRWHYRPLGPTDAVPDDAAAATVALADKLDTLMSFFVIGEKPTGSRDPFALRRAALGVIRIMLEGRIRLPLARALIRVSHRSRMSWFKWRALSAEREILELSIEKHRLTEEVPHIDLSAPPPAKRKSDEELDQDVLGDIAAVLGFFADRLKVLLREQGERHDLVDAVFALGDDDLVRIVSRVNALSGFLATDDGKNLLAGYKRAVNILKAEEKKGALPGGEPVEVKDAPPEELGLIAAVGHMKIEVGKALEKEDFAAAMGELAALRPAVDAFFDKVLVNSTVASERDNRLLLLASVRDAMGRVADFSQVTG